MKLFTLKQIIDTDHKEFKDMINNDGIQVFRTLSEAQSSMRQQVEEIVAESPVVTDYQIGNKRALINYSIFNTKVIFIIDEVEAK